MRVIGVIEMRDDNIPQHVGAFFALLDAMPKPAALTTAAPVLIVPYVFEPQLCQRLINYYETHDVEDSGFMRDVGGKTVGVLDYSHKRRMDCEITDQDLIRTTQERLKRRVVPAIKHAFQFNVTRIERHIVACYDAAGGAHFRRDRDNTTLGTPIADLPSRSISIHPITKAAKSGFPSSAHNATKPPAARDRLLLLDVARSPQGHARQTVRLPPLPLRRSRRHHSRA